MGVARGVVNYLREALAGARTLVALSVYNH